MDRQYDVIIVGCGVAGCFTALHLPSDKKILMITKSSDIEESDSFLAQGGICVLKNENDYDSFFEDTLRAGHYENRKESVDMMIRSSRPVIDELISYGVEFAQDEAGNLCYTREGAHSTNRILYHEDITGHEITKHLLAAVLKLPNVTLLAQTEMLDILCRSNTCDGIVLKDKDGDIQPVFARHVMWASGGIGGIYDNSTNYPHLTGDALALSLKHGVRLENVNYVQIHPTVLYSEKKERRFLISESVRGEGGILLDKNGKRFANELLPRDVLSKAIFEQMEKDNTRHVWLNMMAIQKLDITKRFPHIYEHCLSVGYDITKEWIPVVPAQHYFMGGVWVDLHGHTSMKHLYAAGETCCNGVHGANRLASNSLLESLVFARNAAWHMQKQDENDEKKKEQRKFAAYTKDTRENILKKYLLSETEYEDNSRMAENNRTAIWKEINRENEGREQAV